LLDNPKIIERLGLLSQPLFCFSSSLFQKIPLPNSVLRMISILFWLFQGSFALKYGKIVTKYTSRYQIKRGYL